jgi:hypothetical protein
MENFIYPFTRRNFRMKKMIFEILRDTCVYFCETGKERSLKESAKRIYLLRVARKKSSCKRRLPFLWEGRGCVFSDGTECREWI